MVSDVLQSVGLGFASMETTDPHLDSFGKQDFLLGQYICSYQKNNRPLVRVKPLPICIVLQILELFLA